MREIKFRGINQETGEFVYGWLTKLQSGARLYMSIIVEDNEAEERLTSFYIHDEKTIGQYTGLKDKNGVDIYEGDIVKWIAGRLYWEAVISTIDFAKTNTLYAVETFHNCTTDEEGEFYTYLRSDSRKGIRNDLEYINENIEIIGNIHQNPELLGGNNEA